MSFREHPTKNKHLKLGEPKWYQIREGRGKDEKTHVYQFNSNAEAALFDAELKRQHRPLRAVFTVVKSFNDMLPDFLHYYEHELERQPRAVTAWLQGWNNLKPHFGTLKPTQLTPALIEQYKAHRLSQKAGIRHNTVKKSTVQKELHNLSSFVKFYSEKNICEPLPFRIKGFRKKNTAAAPVIPPTPQQVQDMFARVTHIECLDLYWSYYYTGLRSSELRFLQRKHVYLEWGIITVYGKGGKWRIMPIVPPYRPIIERLCRDAEGNNKEPDDYLLISKRTGKPFSANSGKLDIAAGKAGIQTHITAHVLRKCFSTHCLYWGADMRTVQLLLGHEDIKTTETYTFVPPEMLAEKLASFGILPQNPATMQLPTTLERFNQQST